MQNFSKFVTLTIAKSCIHVFCTLLVSRDHKNRMNSSLIQFTFCCNRCVTVRKDLFSSFIVKGNFALFNDSCVWRSACCIFQSITDRLLTVTNKANILFLPSFGNGLILIKIWWNHAPNLLNSLIQCFFFCSKRYGITFVIQLSWLNVYKN